MLKLNHELLTVEGIIAAFEKEVMKKTEPTSAKAPSLLSQFKTKLKAIYFPENKKSEDNSILAILEQDSRFNSDYPEIKNALQCVFSSSDKETLLSSLKACQTSQNNINPRTETSWADLNTDFGYFNDRPDLFPLFNELVNACRAMIVLVEQNNSPEDTMAYKYAYRLMALYIDPTNPTLPDLKKMAQHAEDLIKSMTTNKNTPYHDVLLNQVQLPNAQDVKSMPGWRQFISQHLKDNAITALRFFAMAPDIEKQIEKQSDSTIRITGFAPQSLAEAKAMAARVHYARGSENPKLALICRECSIPETGPECSFDTCLDYLKTVSWPIKTSDLLPHPEIIGDGVAAAYRWVKLPTDDLRALVLGVITGCCQNIGGPAQRCVEDAISLPENGLYVLLKLKPGKAFDSPSFLPDQSINYPAFEIVGQSYGWISQTGNLTLDSLECSEDRVPTQVAHDLLLQFANQVLEDNPTIKRVALGTGGGTPRALGFNSSIITEKIRSGYHYGDSDGQVCIAIKHQLNQHQYEQLDELLKTYSARSRRHMYELGECIADPENFVDDLKTLLQKDKEPDFELKLTRSNSLSKLLKLNPCPRVADLESLSFEQLKKMSQEEKRKLSFTRLFWNCNNIEYFVDAINLVSDEKIRFYLIFSSDLFFQGHKSAINQALEWAAAKPEYLITLLMMIPKTQLFQLLNERNSFNEKNSFQYALYYCPIALPIIFDYLPMEDRLSALTAEQGGSYSVLAHILNRKQSTDLELLKDLLNKLPLNSFRQVLQLKNSYTNKPFLLEQTRRDPTWLTAILTLYPKNQLVSVLTEKGNQDTSIWDNIVSDFHGLLPVLNYLDKDVCAQLFAIKNKKGDNALSTLFQSYASFHDEHNEHKISRSEILNFLSLEDQRDLLKQKNKQGCNAFNDAFNYRSFSEDFLTPLTEMLSAFTAEECLSIFLECIENPDFPFYKFDPPPNHPRLSGSKTYGPELKQILLDKINSITLDSSISFTPNSYLPKKVNLDSIKRDIENATKTRPQIIESIQHFQKLLTIQKSKQYKRTFNESLSNENPNKDPDETKGQNIP